MMRRFSRRRRGGARPGSGSTPIDPSVALARIVEQQLVPASALEPFPADEVPEGFAVLGSGEARTGGRLLVSFAPGEGSQALLAALAVGGRVVETDSFAGQIYAVAPEWGGAGRRLLGLLGPLAYRLVPVAAPSLAEGSGVRAEHIGSPTLVAPAQIAGHLARPADRDLFLRAARGLEGLAAKHGGALRGYGRALEFVLLARRVAELRAETGGVVLTTLAPQHSSVRLAPDSLSNALDALEGQLRKRLNDRRIRESEEGVRARAIAAFRTWHSLRSLVPWPLGGGDEEVIDWVGVDVEGHPVIGAVREHLGLAELGDIVDAALRLQGSLPSVLAHAAAPVVLDAPRLVMGGREIAPGVTRALDALAVSHEVFQVRGRDGDLEISAVAAGEGARAERSSRRRPERPRRETFEEVAGADEDEAALGEGEEESEAPVEARAGESRGRRRGRGRGRGRRGRRDGGTREPEGDDEGASAETADEEGGRTPRFDEVSLFDLDDEPTDRDREGGGRSRRPRGRGRRRSRGGGGGTGEDGRRGRSEEAAASGPDAPSGRGESRSTEGEAADAEDLDEGYLGDEDADLELDEMAEEVPDFEPEPAPRYEEDEEPGEEEEESDAESAGGGEERGRRRGPSPLPEVAADVPKLPRRRSAILAHADRDSIVAAILIARDIRLLEGLWVYPQSELMTFFRGVATDLREDAPIYVVGFTPKPSVDVLQATSLYRDRMMWFDHREWPPEDLQALRSVLGEDNVQVAPGAGSSLPPVLDCCSRRSRFTDKLVDLVAARFSHHDYERWGRVWWWRLGEIARRTGDRRAEIDELLSGRPSDLAREAARVETPEPPPEVDWVSRRDFRLVHFAGYALVVLEVPEEYDLHLAARIARERYGSPLSLARRPDSEYVFFGGDELAGRRSLDLAAVAEHIANKLEWVDLLADSDHVARIRVRDLATHPDRLDEVVAEVAMGRSILER